MTALTIIQNAANRIKLTTPSAIFSATDDQVVQLRNLMNQEGKELANGSSASDHAWTVLINEKTFSTTAAAAQSGAVPTDFGFYIDDSMWNRTTQQKCVGPLSSQEWQTIQAYTQVGINPRFRFRGGSLLISPTPTAGQTMAYEYVSTYWAQNAAASGLVAMTADTDTALLDEELITQGIIWRFKAAKGIDYAEDFRTYQMNVSKAIARDGGRKIVNMSDSPVSALMGVNVPLEAGIIGT